MAIGVPESTTDAARNGSAPTTTTKWLELAGADGRRWRLPDDTNLDFVEAHLKSVISKGEAFVFEVHGEADKIGRRVVLNGRALGFVELYETAE